MNNVVAWALLIVLGAVAATVAVWLLYLIVSVLYLGGGSSCPQNLC